MLSNIQINENRLWDSLNEMALIGATKKGGVNRQTLTDLDKESRDLFVKWCKEESLFVTVDQIGNIFARREGKNNNLPPIMSGSHLDTQPTGGKYDGALGVLSALEVIRTLNENNYITEAPIEIAMWTNEEGCRFPPSMTGSAVFSGQYNLNDALSIQDPHGLELGNVLKRIQYNGSTPCAPRTIGAFIETHIEQGPILEIEDKNIGIVTGAQAQKWYEINILGMEAHAGPTPMSNRKDALVAASEIVLLVNSIGNDFQPGGCATCGVLEIGSPSRNVIPGKCFLTIDFRHPENKILNEMDKKLRNTIKLIEKNNKVEIKIKQILELKSNVFNKSIKNIIQDVTKKLNYSSKEIVSGAGHDAVNINAIAPTAMIFIPCIDGISHNEVENVYKEDVTKGAQVLLHSMIELADNSSIIIDN
ncbi:MAG: M20 family metallo-hydrolase [Pelagibacterales bacterium]|nr:M20 family metallo-hydrolase [Pelagibacterales bacterium]